MPLLPRRVGGGLVLDVRVLPAAWLILGINLLLCAARLARGWWWQDDLNLLAHASRQGLDPALLFSDYNGHLQPGTWVLAWFFDQIAPMQWWPAALLTLALVAAVDLAALALLRELFGTRPAILVPFAMISATSLTLTATMWWAASVQWLPTTLSLAFGLWCHLRFWDTGRFRYAAGAVLSVVLGLVFFEKALTTLLVLALFSALYLTTGPLWRRPWRAFNAHPAYWLTHAAVAGTFLGLYLARVHFETGFGYRLTDVVTLIRWMVLDTFLPSMIGGPIAFYTKPTTTINAWPHPWPIIALAAWALTAAAVIWSLRTRPGAWRAWTLLVLFLTVSIGLVVRARLGYIGPFIGRDQRYLTDLSLIGPLCLALAWLPLRADANTQAELTPEAPDNRQSWAAAGAALIVLMIVGGGISGEQFMNSWTRNPTKPYLENLQTSLDDAAAAGRTVHLLPETVVPDLVMTPTFEQDRRLSNVVAPFTRKPVFPRYADSYQLVDGQGRVQDASVAGMTAVIPAGNATCLRGTGKLAVDFPQPQAAWQWVVKLDYLAQNDTDVQVSMGPFPAVPIHLRKGLHSVYVDLVGGGTTRLVMAGRDGGSNGVCVGGATIGSLATKR